MTQEEIIDMAEQAGFDPHDMSSDFTCNLQNINAFAKLVAEKAIKESLAQPKEPEQEPVAWEQFYPDIGKPKFVAQPKQEPVKDWIASHNAICALLRQAHDALASTSYPPQRTWVGLTQDELNMIGDSMRTWNSWTITDVYFAIEAKLKQKNGYAEEKNK
jgi:hypothetical protein